MPDYDPSQDYASSYDALSRRISANFGQQRVGLNQELADRGVQTSGVSAIPSTTLRVGENSAKDQVAGQYALEQAQTGIADRVRAQEFQQQDYLANLGYNNQNALARRMGNSGLQASLISGGLGAAGSVLSGAMRPSPVGYGGYGGY